MVAPTAWDQHVAGVPMRVLAERGSDGLGLVSPSIKGWHIVLGVIVIAATFLVPVVPVAGFAACCYFDKPPVSCSCPAQLTGALNPWHLYGSPSYALTRFGFFAYTGFGTVTYGFSLSRYDVFFFNGQA